MVLLPEIEWPAGGPSAAESSYSRFVKNALDFADGRRMDLGDLETVTRYFTKARCAKTVNRAISHRLRLGADRSFELLVMDRYRR